MIKTYKTKFDRAFPIIFVDYKNPDGNYGKENVEKNISILCSKLEEYLKLCEISLNPVNLGIKRSSCGCCFK